MRLANARTAACSLAGQQGTTTIEKPPRLRTTRIPRSRRRTRASERRAGERGRARPRERLDLEKVFETSAAATGLAKPPWPQPRDTRTNSRQCPYQQIVVLNPLRTAADR